MYTKLEGLIAAPHTPFGGDGDVDLSGIDRQIAWLVRSGVRGAYVCGTTGEGMSLTVPERQAIAAHWARQAAGQLDVMIHVGHLAQRDAVALARHADTLEIHSISAIAPCFFKPKTAECLIGYLRPIAAASDKPFYYYHSPGMTGVDIPLTELLQKAQEAMPTFAGVKYNSGDLFPYQQAIAFGDARFDIPFGTDEVLLGALAAGAGSAIGSTYNFAAPLYLALWRAFEQADFEAARGYSQKAVALVRLLLEYGVLPAGKALMSLRGVECGQPRPPVAALSEAARQSLFARVEELGVMDVPLPEAASV